MLADAAAIGRTLGGEGAQSGGNSEDTAKALAIACRKRVGADYALSVAECPDYDPDDPDDEPPTTWVACAGPDGVNSKSLTLLGDVSFTRSRSTKTVLDVLRLMLAADG